MTLTEALERVPLQPGRYQCQIHGYNVELRVDPIASAPGGISEDDVMLDPWFEFPDPEPSWIVKATPGPTPVPSRVEFPPDGDKPA